MPACRPWSYALSWVPIVLLSLAGCNGSAEVRDDADPLDPEYRRESSVYEDDLGRPIGREPITAESLGETRMINRRMMIEIRGGTSVPLPTYEDNDFEPGPMLGAKLELEAVKNLFFGISFDWARQEVDQGVETLVDDPEALPGVGPDQLFDYLDRFNFLALFDYDVVLVKNTVGAETPLIFRFGVGAGLTIIDGKEDPEVVFDISTFYGFLLRPSVGLRWQFHPNIIFLTEVNYDFVIPNRIYARVSTPTGREKSKVEGDVDFGSLNLIVGLGFQF